MATYRTQAGVEFTAEDYRAEVENAHYEAALAIGRALPAVVSALSLSADAEAMLAAMLAPASARHMLGAVRVALEDRPDAYVVGGFLALIGDAEALRREVYLDRDHMDQHIPQSGDRILADFAAIATRAAEMLPVEA